jgi:hypothetical protein
MFSIRYPSFSGANILLILFTVLITSKILHQAYWYFSIIRKK